MTRLAIARRLAASLAVPAVAAVVAALGIAGAACRSDEPPAIDITAAPLAPAVARPAPGIDITAAPLAPTVARPAPPHRAPREPRALGADRAIVPVSVPRPPAGGAVAFRFADDRPGWVTRIPDGEALPAVAYGGDTIFVSGGFQSVTFYGLDAASGRIRWATTNLEDYGPTAPVYDDGRVVFNTESCTLFVLDARTGKRLWQRRIGDPTLAQTAVADGIVYASHPGDGGHALSAFRVDTGAWLWSRWIGNELLAAPVVGRGAVYASTIDGLTFAFAARDGAPLWRARLDATTAPWPAGDELFVTRRRAGKEQQIVVAAATGAIVREHDTSHGAHAWDVPRTIDDARAVWQFEGSRAVVERGIRYVAMGGEIRASDAATGEPLWQRRHARLDARSLGSVALAGAQVIAATRDGKLFGLDVDTGATLWSYDIGHRVDAQPIVARGWVYAATTDGYVVALGVGDATLDGWHMFGGNAAHAGPVPAAPRAEPPMRL